MWSRKQSEAANRLAPILEKDRKQSEAAKRLAPILEKERAKNGGTEWLRYTDTTHQIDTMIIGFELTDEQAEELKRNMSGETYKHLNDNSYCQLKAMDVKTDRKLCIAMIIVKKSNDKLLLSLTNCTGCDVGKTIDFDFCNSFWKDDDHCGCDRVFYGVR